MQYDSNHKRLGIVIGGGVGKGNFDWKKIAKKIIAARDARYMQIEIWYENSSEIWLKDPSLKKEEDNWVDVLWIYSLDSSKRGVKIEDLFKAEEKPAEIISYEKINPTLWKVKIRAKKPFMLSFAESYDPLWEARVYKDGKLVEKVGATPLYSVINGFWINETGNLEIVIRYKPQDWFEIGLGISALTFIGCISYLFYDWRKSKGDEWVKRLEKKFRKVKKRLQ